MKFFILFLQLYYHVKNELSKLLSYLSNFTKIWAHKSKLKETIPLFLMLITAEFYDRVITLPIYARGVESVNLFTKKYAIFVKIFFFHRLVSKLSHF
jgi:hypothetical protein